MLVISNSQGVDFSKNSTAAIVYQTQSLSQLYVMHADTRGRQQGPYHVALALQLSSALCQVLGDGCVAHIPPTAHQLHLMAYGWAGVPYESGGRPDARRCVCNAD